MPNIVYKPYVIMFILIALWYIKAGRLIIKLIATITIMPLSIEFFFIVSPFNQVCFVWQLLPFQLQFKYNTLTFDLQGIF